MAKYNFLFISLVAMLFAITFFRPTYADDSNQGNNNSKRNASVTDDKKNAESMRNLPDSYWKNKLDPSIYNVTRCSATEMPFTGKYWNNHESGLYKCSNCGQPLFDSNDKFDSGTGWPSFTKPANPHAVDERIDHSLGMERDEVICKHCGAHLGHLFTDGPAPTGQRFCINSAALDFDKNNKKNEFSK